MPANRHSFTLLVLLAVGTGAVLAASAVVFAQDRSHIDHAQHIHGGEAVIPTMPGQDAFGAIQEIVAHSGGRSQNRLEQDQSGGACASTSST